MIDHKAEALHFADMAEGPGWVAQVHATLYLAEQQRLANIIKLESMTPESYDRLSINTSTVTIREGLGL